MKPIECPQHPDHACAIARLDAGQDWAALAILEAADEPRAGLAADLIRRNQVDKAREQIQAGEGEHVG